MQLNLCQRRLSFPLFPPEISVKSDPTILTRGNNVARQALLVVIYGRRFFGCGRVIYLTEWKMSRWGTCWLELSPIYCFMFRGFSVRSKCYRWFSNSQRDLQVGIRLRRTILTKKALFSPKYGTFIWAMYRRTPQNQMQKHLFFLGIKWCNLLKRTWKAE